MAASDHTIQELIKYARGIISPESAEGRRIEATLETDDEARDVVRIARLARHGLPTDESDIPSSAMIEKAQAIFDPSRLPGTIGRWLAGIDRVIASLTFDSRVQPATAGLRGTAAPSRIQLSYEAGDIDVEVQIERIDGETWRLMGQIDGDDSGAERTVAITAAGSPTDILQTITADEHGMFSAEVATGNVDIHIQCGESAVTLPGIDLTIA